MNTWTRQRDTFKKDHTPNNRKRRKMRRRVNHRKPYQPLTYENKKPRKIMFREFPSFPCFSYVFTRLPRRFLLLFLVFCYLASPTIQGFLSWSAPDPKPRTPNPGPMPRARAPSGSKSLTLGVQVATKHILTPNLYHNFYYPKPKYLIIGYLDPKP